MWPFSTIARLKSQLADAHAYVDTLEDRCETFVRLINEADRRRKILLTADGIKQQTIDALTDQRNDAEAERARVTLELSNASTKMAHLEIDVVRLTRELAGLQARHDKLQENYDIGKKQYEDVKRDLAEVTKERDARTQQLVDAAAKRSDAIRRGNLKRYAARRAGSNGMAAH